MPARTVTRILRRHDMARLSELDPMTGDIIRASKTTAVRYERDTPGELVHVDVKKLGKIPDGGGWKAWGRQIGSSSAARKARPGYDFVHSAVDDHTRLAYSEILPDEKGDTCAGFVARAAAWFADNGIAHIAEVMTDNGSDRVVVCDRCGACERGDRCGERLVGLDVGVVGRRNGETR